MPDYLADNAFADAFVGTAHLVPLTGHAPTDAHLRSVASLADVMRAAGQQLDAYADTSVGRIQRQRAGDAAWRELETTFGSVRDYAKGLRTEGTALYAQLRAAVLASPAGADRALEAEREAEIRAHYRTISPADRSMALQAAALAGDSRTIRALVAQNPSLPILPQEDIDAAVPVCSRAMFPEGWDNLDTIERRAAAVEYAVTGAENLAAKHVGPRPMGVAQ